MDLDFPYHVDDQGRTATSEGDEHLRDLIEQVLFTAPGERVMRPEFGTGLLSLVFEPNGSVLATTTQMLAQGALQLHLGDRIAVESVDVTNDEGTLRVEVKYTPIGGQASVTASFVHPGGRP